MFLCVGVVVEGIADEGIIVIYGTLDFLLV